MNGTAVIEPGEEIAEEKVKKPNNFVEFLKRLTNNKLALAMGIVFLLLILMAIFADQIAPYYWRDIDMTDTYARPSAAHLFGTDQYGRDIFSRVVYGARWSLSLGLVSTVISMVLGIVVGSIAGYYGGAVDTLIMRLIDVVQCLPGMLLTICIAMILGSGFFNTVLAMSFGGIWGTARMMRAQILSVRETEYVEGARATNCTNGRIITKYVLPNAIQPIIIDACMSVGGAIMQASSLSFLGLGVQPPYPEWGAMLSDGRLVMRYYPNMLLAPCAAIAITVLAVSIFGDGIRDALDPHMKK